MAGDQMTDQQRRSTLLFFAPEQQDQTILTAYWFYLESLDQSGQFDITIMAPNGSPFAREARGRGFRLHPMSDFARKLLLRTPQLWPILTATRRYRYDVALCHQGYGCRGLSQIARSVIGICHDDQFGGFATADRLIVLTSGAADMANALLDGTVPVDILPYPYDCQFDAPFPLPEQKVPLTIGAAGPLEERNGLGMFIHTAQLLHQSCPDVRFVIAGDGPMEHDLKELSDQIAPFIDFPGALSSHELAEQVDLFCLTASEAPYSLALCEMMDAGIACVATSSHGSMDILKGGMVAPLVPVDDAFMLAVQLQELLEDRAHIERIRQSCFERIREEDFDSNQFTERLLALICNK